MDIPGPQAENLGKTLAHNAGDLIRDIEGQPASMINITDGNMVFNLAVGNNWHPEFIFNDDIRFGKRLINIAAVSYTHLDVYKRQVRRFPATV